jgi:hypothetical protein
MCFSKILFCGGRQSDNKCGDAFNEKNIQIPSSNIQRNSINQAPTLPANPNRPARFGA